MGGGRDDLPLEVLEAARDGNVPALRALLKECPPNASNSIGQTAMHFASMWGHADTVSTLLDAGADINAPNDNGKTPLFYAVRNDRIAVVRLLLKRGAKIRELSKMLKAAEGTDCEDEVVALLQLHSGPSNEVSQAVKALDLDKLRGLLDAGKLMENEAWDDPRDRTPLHHAVLAIIAIVEQRVEQDRDNWFGASDGLAALEMLVQAAETAGEGIVQDACNTFDDEGNSPLHVLVQAGFFAHPAALTLLLRAGADPNVQSMPSESEYTSGQWGRQTATGEKEVLTSTPDRSLLHSALMFDEPSETIVKLLLEHHADLNVRDSEQRSALHIALDFDDDRGGIDLEMCELLLRHNADPSLGSHEIGTHIHIHIPSLGSHEIGTHIYTYTYPRMALTR